MVHPDYFDAETQSSKHLLEDCNDGIIRPPYTNVNTPSNSTLDVTTAQIEGYANFPLSQGPGKSHIPEDSVPMGFADIDGEIIHVGGGYETHKDGKVQALSYINTFSEQGIAADGCYPHGVYDGYDENGTIMCTCGEHGQYCSDDFLDSHEDLRHSGSYETSGSFSSFYHSGHETDDFERRQAAGIPISCDDWISQNCDGIPDQLGGVSDPYLSGVGTCWDILGHDCSETCLTQEGRDGNYCNETDTGTDTDIVDCMTGTDLCCSSIIYDNVHSAMSVSSEATGVNVELINDIINSGYSPITHSTLCGEGTDWNMDGVVPESNITSTEFEASLAENCCGG